MRGLSLTFLAVAAAVIAGTVTFLAGRPADSGRQSPDLDAPSQWPVLDHQQVQRFHEIDPDYPQESSELITRLSDERARLAEILESEGASDEAILTQVEVVIAAYEALMDRVVEHVLCVRPHLPVAQQRKLMGLCVDSLSGKYRMQARRRWRGPPEDGRPRGGFGKGKAMSVVRHSDDEFANELDQMQGKLSDARTRLAEMLIDQRSSDDQIRQQARALAKAHSAMDMLVASHVLKVRGVLTAEQQKTLILMCNRGILGVE